MTTGGRSLPEALRWGLTFWRRSIQARVVVSTLLLSALVVTGVGWFLLRQVEQGLVDHRVAAVLKEVDSESEQVRQQLTSMPGTDTDAVAQSKDLANTLYQQGQARGFDVVLADPGTGTVALAFQHSLGTWLVPDLHGRHQRR